MTISRANRLHDDWCLDMFLHDRGFDRNLELTGRCRGVVCRKLPFYSCARAYRCGDLIGVF